MIDIISFCLGVLVTCICYFAYINIKKIIDEFKGDFVLLQEYELICPKCNTVKDVSIEELTDEDYVCPLCGNKMEEITYDASH